MTVEHDTKRKRFRIDREQWGDGPWNDEPDHVAFVTRNDMPAIAHRGPSGAWCGYVAVPPGHPLHGKSYASRDCYERSKDDPDELDYDRPISPSVHDINVHGGITYAEKCAGEICHVPAPGEPDDVWWLGFDCSHAWDTAPGDEAFWRQRGYPPSRDTAYRTLSYVREECESLAAQLESIAQAVIAAAKERGELP